MARRIRIALVAPALLAVLLAPSSAAAAASSVSWSPRHLSFAPTPVGVASETLTATLTNGTSQPVYVLNGDSGGPDHADFWLGPATTGDCRTYLISGTPIAPGGSCFLPLFFQPDDAGAHRAWLLFYLAPSQYTAIENATYVPTLQLRGRGI